MIDGKKLGGTGILIGPLLSGYTKISVGASVSTVGKLVGGRGLVGLRVDVTGARVGSLVG